AYNYLGGALAEQKKPNDAVTAFKKAIELQPDFAEAYNNLGNALRAQKKLGEAVAAYKKAIDLHPDFAAAYNNLSNALREQKKKLGEAATAYKKAIELNPDLAEVYYNLGITLAHQKKLEEAVTAYKKAIHLSPDLAEAHCNLGHVLRDQGQFAEALTYLRRGHGLGSRNPRWPYPSAQWVGNCELLVELNGKLAAILSGQKQPTDAAEPLALGQLCQMPYKKQYAAATRFYREAFAEKPQLADDLNAQFRYNAACAAALAGCGQGKDADTLDAKERSRL